MATEAGAEEAAASGDYARGVRRILVRPCVFKVGLVLLVLSLCLFFWGMVSPAWATDYSDSAIGVWRYCAGDVCHNNSVLDLGQWINIVRVLVMMAAICFGVAVIAELYQDVLTRSQLFSPGNRLVEIVVAFAVSLGAVALTIFAAEWSSISSGKLAGAYFATSLACVLGAISIVLIWRGRSQHTAIMALRLAPQGLAYSPQPSAPPPGLGAPPPGLGAPPPGLGVAPTPHQRNAFLPTDPLLTPGEAAQPQEEVAAPAPAGAPPSYDSVVVRFPPPPSAPPAMPPTSTADEGGPRPASGAYDAPPVPSSPETLPPPAAEMSYGVPSVPGWAPPSSAVPGMPPGRIPAVPGMPPGRIPAVPGMPPGRIPAVPGMSPGRIPVYFIMVEGQPVPVYDQPPPSTNN